MTPATMAFIEYVRKLELEPDDDWPRQMVQQFTQGWIELGAEQKIGAARHEHSPKRQVQLNGYRERRLATRVGNLELRIHKLRPNLSMISKVEGCSVSPRKSRSKFWCISSSATGMPWQANIFDSAAPAGPPPTTMQAVSD
jgi:hypothetical protein